MQNVINLPLSNTSFGPTAEIIMAVTMVLLWYDTTKYKAGLILGPQYLL
jgi:hypothetical protein